ncbi:MAG: hypothetical protein LBM02_09820 [Lachnospiraceae bacterium]|jgi:hypothetical protein|nr:hypothetical protein [Lachnospiraceae bacterium]
MSEKYDMCYLERKMRMIKNLFDKIGLHKSFMIDEGHLYNDGSRQFKEKYHFTVNVGAKLEAESLLQTKFEALEKSIINNKYYTDIMPINGELLSKKIKSIFKAYRDLIMDEYDKIISSDNNIPDLSKILSFDIFSLNTNDAIFEYVLSNFEKKINNNHLFSLFEEIKK